MTSNNKGKYQPWSHEEFMADRKVRRMPSVALKTYMMLLHEAFVCSTRPNLPDDEEELEQMAYCTDHEEWLSVRSTVLAMFDRAEVDGHAVLINKRLNRDWENLQKIRETKSEAGKLGAEARWGSKNGTNMAEDGKPHFPDSKEVSKEVKEESQVSNEEEPDMKLKDELTKIAVQYGARAGGFKTTWDEIKTLGVAHGTGAVATDFTGFMQEMSGDDFPAGAVVSYLRVASERLNASSAPATVISRDPEVVSLVRGTDLPVWRQSDVSGPTQGCSS